nr:hypothetical protein CFP56_23454 [Quercus suber]
MGEVKDFKASKEYSNRLMVEHVDRDMEEIEKEMLIMEAEVDNIVAEDAMGNSSFDLQFVAFRRAIRLLIVIAARSRAIRLLFAIVERSRAIRLLFAIAA